MLSICWKTYKDGKRYLQNKRQMWWSSLFTLFIYIAAGQVSRALISKGGETIAQECRQKASRWYFTPPEFVVTSGGRLPCNKIAHLAIDYPPQPEKFLAKLEKVFAEAENLHMTSIAVPAIGTGL